MSFDNFDFISQQQERQYKSIDLSIFKAMQLLKLLKQVKNLYAFTIKITGTGRGRGRGCRAGRTEGRMRCLRMEHCKTWEQRFVPHVGAKTQNYCVQVSDELYMLLLLQSSPGLPANATEE